MTVDAYVLILSMIGIGALFARLKLLPEDSAQALNLIALYICLPAAVLRHAPQLQLDARLLGLVAVPWIILAVSASLVLLLSRAFNWSRGETAVLLLLLPLGNTSYLGFPLTEALLGAEALPYAVVYDQFGSFLMLSSYGLWVLATYGGDRKPTLAGIGKRIIAFPPFIALVLGFTVMPAQPPVVVAELLDRLAALLLPLVTLAIGLGIRLSLPRRELLPLAVGLATKLLLLPGLVWLALAWLPLEGNAARVAVLETAMPPMITAAALAASHRLAPRLASAMVGYGILLSLVTLPMWARLIA
ncbi:MAG: AEC family transporter [Lysobacteraceae bacterium]